MKNEIWRFPLILAGIGIILFNACKKEDDTNQPAHILLTTNPATEITKYTALSGGTVAPDENKIILDCGICWSPEKPSVDNPVNLSDSITTDSLVSGTFISLITDLKAGEEYFIRAYVTFVHADSLETGKHITSYGKVISFTTIQEKVITSVVSNFTQRTITSGGNITSEFGPEISARGLCWNTIGSPTLDDDTTYNGTDSGGFISTIQRLEPNTAYFIRAYASNGTEVFYGQQIIVKTLSAPEPDIDGNDYNTVGIGTQVWMVENLKTTHYRDGSEIRLIESHASWDTAQSPAYCWYNNDESNKENYGALYNWYAIDSLDICPTGWHVPTDADWLKLINAFGGEEIAGIKLKESGLDHWLSPNDQASNESGFTGLPCGGRNFVGTFDDLGQLGYWWSATEFTNNFARFYFLNYNGNKVTRNILDKRSGLSVRCIQD